MLSSFKFVQFVVTFFYVGKLSKAPGTFGTLAAIPLWYFLNSFSPLIYMTCVIGLLLLGIIYSQAYEGHIKTHDNSEVVIDEVVGFLITMTWLPITWQSVVCGFVLFRFFDIVKPPPIKQLDQRIPGGLGVMIDDVAAGIISSILLQIIYTKTSWLGAQIQTF